MSKLYPTHQENCGSVMVQNLPLQSKQDVVYTLKDKLILTCLQSSMNFFLSLMSITKPN